MKLSGDRRLYLANVSTAYVQIAFACAFLFGGAAVLLDGDFFNNGIEGQASDFFYFSTKHQTLKIAWY